MSKTTNWTPHNGGIKKLKTCKRCGRQYIGNHKCEVVQTEAERIKQEGRY